MITIITAILLVSTILCGYVAKTRGLPMARWIAIALVFGPLAIPFVYLMPVPAGKERKPDEPI